MSFAAATTENRAGRPYSERAGGALLGAFDTAHQLIAFMLITLGVMVMKRRTARGVMGPRARAQIARAGLRLMPMMMFLGFALGLVVIGQTVFLLNRFGAQSYTGTVMVTVVVRELGPLLAALMALARAGTANVVELGTARAQGEVEALEALGIDPIHYLVAPRVVGMAAAVFSLTVYLILMALLSGYLFAFLQGVPLTPGDYFRQLALSMIWQDFALLALKTLSFGALIAVVTCYEGLARPLRLEGVSRAAARAVGECAVGVFLLDAVFMITYWAL